jgi:hypothetical protein
MSSVPVLWRKRHKGAVMISVLAALYFCGAGSGLTFGPKYGAVTNGNDGRSNTNIAGISAGIERPKGNLEVIAP